MFKKVSHKSVNDQNIGYNGLNTETQSKDKQMSKRMQLKLDEKTYELIKELSEVSGMSASSLVTVMFQISREDIKDLISRIRRLGAKPSNVFDTVVNTLERQGYGYRGALSTRRSKDSKGGKEDV